MTLFLKVLSGKFVGKAFEFDERKVQRVRIGRSMDSEVSWPEEEPIVGRDHFELRYEAGAWKFVVSPEHRVFVHGKDAYQGMALEDEMVAQLGSQEGPSLSLKHMRAESNQTLTPAQGKAVDDRGLIERARANIGLVVAGVAVLASLGGYLIAGLRGSVSRLDNAVVVAALNIEEQGKAQEKVREGLATLAGKTDFTEVFDRSKASVFLVDIVGPGNVSQGGATAWVVKLKDGSKAFATNGHVAAAFETMVKGNTKGLKMVARSPMPGHKEYEITGQITHPGYAAFEDKAQELDAKLMSGEIRDLGLMTGYDVALLIPASQDGLPEPLTLANDNELAALRSGETLGMAGYPMENVNTTDRMEPTPVAQKGIVTSMTSFFLMPAGADSQLVQHNLPATGGSSGSPMFNAAGHVVALLNAGNITTTGEGARTPSAVMVNFGQRVDLLRELIDGTADERMSIYRQSWADAEEKVKYSVTQIVEREVAAFKAQNASAEEVGTAEGTIETASPAYNGHLAVSLNLNVEAGYHYLVFATSQDKGAKLSAVLYDAASTGYLDVNEADAPIARLDFDAQKSETALLDIVSAADGADGKPDPAKVKFNVVVWRTKN